LAKTQHVGIVVLAGEAGAFLIPAKGATDASDLIGGYGLAISRAAQHDPPLTFPARDRFGGGPDKQGIIDWLGAVRPEIAHLMAKLLQKRYDLLLVIVTRMIGTSCNFHLWNS